MPAKTNFVVCMYGALTCFDLRLYGKFPALQGEISVVDSELALLSYKRKQILTTNLTETRDLGNEGQPYQ